MEDLMVLGYFTGMMMAAAALLMKIFKWGTKNDRDS